MAEEAGEGKGGFAKLMKWVGIAAALISLGTGIYELLHAQAELRERRRVVAEQVGAGREQQAAGYYPAAWDSFEEANTTAQPDGLFAKLLGGLSEQRQQIRAAQEDLAMEWIRTARATEGQSFATLADKLVNTLAAGANVASGARKADLLAHLGWAYFLKFRSGDLNVKPDVPYREAVTADPTAPYANAFWGHWILWTHGPLAEANKRFEAALATERARVDVRHFQLAALANVHSEETDAAWLGIVTEMHEKGEAFDAAISRDLYGRYYFALSDPTQLESMLAAVPADRQIGRSVCSRRCWPRAISIRRRRS